MIIESKLVCKEISKELPRETYVHSIFDNGFNLVGNSCLIFVTHDRTDLSPGSLVLDRSDYEKIRKYISYNCHMTYDNAYLSNSKFSINIKEENYLDFSIRHFIKARKNIEDYNKLQEYISNLDIETGFFKPINLINNDRHISNLEKIYNLNNKMKIKNVLRKILGKGQGLTPSGDDFLIGFLWVNEIFNILSSQFKNSIYELLKEDITTDVSKSYLRYALRGMYSSALIELYISLENNGNYEEVVNKIIDYGSTSGIDTLSGILYGLGVSK